MVENNRKFDGSHLEPLGLFRRGDYSSDTRITAFSPDGNPVELYVYPIKVEGGTLFVPRRGQEGLKQLFPPSRRSI